MNKKVAFRPCDFPGTDFLTYASRLVTEYYPNHPNAFYDNILEFIEASKNFDKQFLYGTSDSNNPMTFGQLETLFVELRKNHDYADIKFFINELKIIKMENDLIIKKKHDYLQKGIRVRKYRFFQTSLMTLGGRIHFKRMALIPSTPKDVAKFKELGEVRGQIFPLDEALGLTKLPFKITVAAMLEIAKESTRCESYEEAEQILKEMTSIQINDDTMRKVTNTIGTIVYNNDVKSADSLWSEMEAGRLTFPEAKIDHTLFLEADGAMLPTRQKGQKGVVYKENKLGMAFSSKHFHCWKTDDGTRKHSLTQREYTALVGDSANFTKLMFNLAVKNGYGQHKKTVFITDGATWLRNMKNYIFPDAQQILDYYHLCEHISDFLKLLIDPEDKKFSTTSKQICDLFRNSNSINAIKILKNITNKKNISNLDKLLNYIDNNKDNIDYKRYKSLGYDIGSGAIESSNKTVLQRRLKYGAMRWNIESGQAVITLVAKKRSGLWYSDVISAIYDHYGEPCPKNLTDETSEEEDTP
jgi:hypothetical protein